MQALERAGKTLAHIKGWLQEHGVEVSRMGVSRTLDKIRVAAPLAPPPAPQLEPATEEDDLAVVRRAARDDMREGEWRKRQGAMGLLLRVAELRRKVHPVPLPLPAAISRPTTAASSRPEMTAEQEEAEARRQLGKMN